MKALPREQLESRKAQAVRFVRDVLGDDDRAAQIEDESLEDYAARRKIEILNNPRGETMASKAELLERINDLEQENEDLQTQLDEIADIVAPPEEAEEEEAEEGE